METERMTKIMISQDTQMTIIILNNGFMCDDLSDYKETNYEQVADEIFQSFAPESCEALVEALRDRLQKELDDIEESKKRINKLIKTKL